MIFFNQDMLLLGSNPFLIIIITITTILITLIISSTSMSSDCSKARKESNPLLLSLLKMIAHAHMIYSNLFVGGGAGGQEGLQPPKQKWYHKHSENSIKLF